MTHPAAWTCRACGFVLGQVRGGVVRPLAPVELIDAHGVARLRCPACGAARHWSPAGASAATAGQPQRPDNPG